MTRESGIGELKENGSVGEKSQKREQEDQSV